jgi:ubiquitin-like protein ATG12
MDQAGDGTGGAGAATPIPDEEQGADLPLTMSASVVLTGLPRDAHQALADVEAIDAGKGEESDVLIYERF